MTHVGGVNLLTQDGDYTCILSFIYYIDIQTYTIHTETCNILKCNAITYHIMYVCVYIYIYIYTITQRITLYDITL